MSTTFRIKNGDFCFEQATGKSEMVDKENKLRQDLVQIYLSNFDPLRNYGSRLFSGGNVPFFGGRSFILSEASDTIDRLQGYQQSDQYLDEEEKIVTISSLDVNMIDDTDAVLFISVRTPKKISVEEEIYIPAKTDHISQINVQKLVGL